MSKTARKMSSSVKVKDIPKINTSGITLNLVLHIILIMIGTTFIFGWSLAAVGQPTEHIKEFFKDAYAESYGKEPSDFIVTTLWSVTNAVIYPAGMIGSLLSSMPSDIFGRKRAVMVSHVPNVIGCLLQTISVPAKQLEIFIVGRFIQGISCGMYAAICTTYLTEIAPLKLRGVVGCMHEVSFSAGILIASVVGLNDVIGTSTLWHYITPLSLIPVALSCLALPMFPDSPRYLMLYKQDEDAAVKALQFLRKVSDVSEEMKAMEKEAIECNKSKQMTISELVKTPHIRKPLFIVCCLQAMTSLTGISIILYYSTTIFDAAGVSRAHGQYAVIGQNSILLLMSVIGALLMDRVGRRRLLLVPLAIIVVSLAILTVAIRLQSNYEALSYLSIIASAVIVGAYSAGLGTVSALVGSEMFRQGPRAVALSCAGMTKWFFFFVVMMSFELIQDVLKEYTLLIFLVLSSLWLVFIYFKVPETKHRTFEEIASLFEDTKQSTDVNMKI